MKKEDIKEPKYNPFIDGFLGWNNIKWLVREIFKIYSNRKSYFSKKRIESGIGFAIAEWGMIYYLIKKIETMDMIEFGAWATIQFFIAGYIIKQIQKEKIVNPEPETTSDETNEDTQ